MPELVPVRITLLQGGRPLAGASVRLIPDDANSPWSSGGSTDNSGVATVLTHGEYAGAPAGAYKVTVSKVEMPPPQSGSSLENLDRPAAAADNATYDLVAVEYSSPEKTPLKLEAKAGAGDHKFDLGPAVRIKKAAPSF